MFLFPPAARPGVVHVVGNEQRLVPAHLLHLSLLRLAGRRVQGLDLHTVVNRISSDSQYRELLNDEWQ